MIGLANHAWFQIAYGEARHITIMTKVTNLTACVSGGRLAEVTLILLALVAVPTFFAEPVSRPLRALLGGFIISKHCPAMSGALMDYAKRVIFC
jgi:hypothetical protein